MRPWPLVPVVVLCAFPPGAAAQSPTGGVASPSGSGGAEYGVPAGASKRAPKRPRAPLRTSHFSVSPRDLKPGGAARLVYRVDGPSRRVRVRVELVRRGARSATQRIRLGWKHVGRRHVNRWPVPAEGLPAGRYIARLHAVDDRGGTLARTASASGKLPVRVAAPPPPPPAPAADGLFPIQGDWTWGGEGSQFGADRGSHRHQGQDLFAAKGTPVVSPLAGSVRWKAYQAEGAGHYLVVRGDDKRDYVFMHLLAGSITVAKGDTVTPGQAIGRIGSSGRSDGAHLHFEIWPCGWFDKGCEPIDPRPQLESWATASRS